MFGDNKTCVKIENKIRNIYYRAKKVMNHKVNLVTYIPPPLWPIKSKIIANCKIAQKSNPKLQYQVRLGTSNVQLYTKEVGDQFFRETPNALFGPVPDITKTKYSPIKERMILSTNKRPRSLSPESANKQQRLLNSDSSMELDQTILNDAMDALTSNTVL